MAASRTRLTHNLASRGLRVLFFLSFAAFPVLALLGNSPERSRSFEVAATEFR